MSETIRYPVPADGTSVSIAGSFNDWQPEPMNLSKDNRTYEKTIQAQNKSISHEYKFVLSSGEWALEEGRPSVANQDGVFNHRITFDSSTLDSALSDDVVLNAQSGEKDHIAPPETVSVSKDLGTEVINKATKNNEYPADSQPATSSGPGLVDPDDSRIQVGNRASSSTSSVSHDSHLNPAAPAFNPVAAPFIPASSGPRQSHSNSRSSHRQRSQSRSRTSHSRSSSIISSRPRSNSSLHHEELNPAAHEFKPQFAQPTNHIPHASGYAAALKKPASPPIKEEFRKPSLTAKQGPSQCVAASTGHESERAAAGPPAPASSQVNAATPISYAAIAKHGTSESGSETNSVHASAAPPTVSESKQKSAIDQHKDPILTKDVIRAGQMSSGSFNGPSMLGHTDFSRADAKDLESAIEHSDSVAEEDVEQVTQAAKSEVDQAHPNMLDPAIESLKNRSSAQDFVPNESLAAPPGHQTVAEIAHANTERGSSKTQDQSPPQQDKHDGSSPIQTQAAGVAESVKSSMLDLQQQTMDTTQAARESVQPLVNRVQEQGTALRNNVLDASSAVTESITATTATLKETIGAEHENSTEKKSQSSRSAATNAQIDTIKLSSADYDAEQIRLMDEVCILLDRDDHPLGSATKKDAHLMSNINEGLLHRAFSLFIFNSDNKLLLQQRASEKITFPDMWTNTCCSHPLDISGENSNTLQGSIEGVKRAAQRKVDQELGISASEAPVADMTFLTRIHYLAPSDGNWGEHEIDYILFLRSTPSLSVNPNEVKDHKWVSQADLREMFKSSDLSYTPWFKLICETFLYKWWDNLENLETCKDEETIHRLGIEPELYEKIQHVDDSPIGPEAHAGVTEKNNVSGDFVSEASGSVQSGTAKVVAAVSQGSEAVLDGVSNIRDRIVDQVSSLTSDTKDLISSETHEPADNAEPAAESSLPVGQSTEEPDFEPSTVQPTPSATTTTENGPIIEESEPAAEDSTIVAPESKDAVESEIQESFNATRTEADAKQSAKTPDAVLELSPAGEAKVAAHAKHDSEAVSKPGTGKSIRAKQNFFFYIFNSLFGGLFRGFSSIFHKLAFWRSNPRQSQD